MAQSAQELGTIFAVSVKKYYEPIEDAEAKLVQAKSYTDLKISQVDASSTGIIIDDNLTSTDVTHALSAKQGSILKAEIDDKVSGSITQEQSDAVFNPFA